MLRVRAGYCGGTTESPNYQSIGDHTEAIGIDFDPTVTSYEELLERFWAAHRCSSAGGRGQYMVAVFYHNEAQRALAERTRAKAAAREGISVDEVGTHILPVRTFTYAEAYHQNYYLGRHPSVRKFLAETYPTAKELADSTVATRLNGFLGSGFERDPAVLENEIGSYGLPVALREKVLARVRKR